MVTRHQRAVLLNLAEQIAALMSECGVTNLAFQDEREGKPSTLLAILTPGYRGQSYLKLSGEAWCELSTLPLAITATPRSQDSTIGACNCYKMPEDDRHQSWCSSLKGS